MLRYDNTRRLTGEGRPACDRCGQTARKGDLYCGSCGEKVQAEVRCEEKFEACGSFQDLKDWMREFVLPDAVKSA